MILGLMGEAGAGKDYVADFLVNQYDNIQKIAFADKLKHMASDLFCFDIDYAYTHAGKKRILPGVEKSIRTILQEFGDKMRQIHPPIWIEYVLKHSAHNATLHTVIPDVRYRNEMEAIQNNDGKVVRIIRLGHQELSGSEAKHPSEAEQRTIKDNELDGVITAADGDLGGLQDMAKFIWHKFVSDFESR